MLRHTRALKVAALLSGVIGLAAVSAAQEGQGAAPRNDLPITIDVIGFDVDADTAQQLSDLARAGGGQYYPAGNEAELTDALRRASGLGPLGTVSAEQEDNNTLGKANAIASGGPVSASIEPAGDKDFFVIEVQEQGLLELRLTNSPAALQLRARAFNPRRGYASGNLQALRAGAEVSEVVDIPGKGRYYVFVENMKNDVGAPETYTLEVQFRAGDAHEPNPTIGTATRIAPDEQLSGSINPKGDVDYYTFEVPRRGALHVNITGSPAEIQTRFRLYNADRGYNGPVFTALAKGADNAGTIDLPVAGRYTLEVAHHKNDARSHEMYNLQLSYDPGDNFEPNEKHGTATKIDATTQFFASILPAGDVDFYTFDVDQPGCLLVKIGNAPANQILQFRAYHAERGYQGPVISAAGKGGENDGVVQIPTPGTYYLQVWEKDKQRSAQQYSLELRFDPADAHELNQALATATPIRTGQAVQATILPLGDVDYFEFELAQAGPVSVTIGDVPDELHVMGRLYNAEWGHASKVLPFPPGAPLTETVELKQAGRYYLLVYDDKNDAVSTTPFTITISAGAAGTP